MKKIIPFLALFNLTTWVMAQSSGTPTAGVPTHGTGSAVIKPPSSVPLPVNTGANTPTSPLNQNNPANPNNPNSPMNPNNPNNPSNPNNPNNMGFGHGRGGITNGFGAGSGITNNFGNGYGTNFNSNFRSRNPYSVDPRAMGGNGTITNR
jgi:hypothetical protein